MQGFDCLSASNVLKTLASDPHLCVHDGRREDVPAHKQHLNPKFDSCVRMDEYVYVCQAYIHVCIQIYGHS